MKRQLAALAALAFLAPADAATFNVEIIMAACQSASCDYALRIYKQ